MRFLYVFPHPDDESFGPALAIARQRREGDSVNLLKLTRGGATRQDPIARVGRVVSFDVYREELDPWLDDLAAGIPGER